MASERMAQRQYENAVGQSASWENKAKAALQKGDTNMAKAALANKVKTDEQVETYYKMYQDISTQTEALRGQVEALKSKLDEAKSREAMLIARAQMAETKKSLAQTAGGIDTDSAFEKFNRMEEKIARKEAEADAFVEISGGTTSDMSKFAQLETDAKVDEELQRLMEEMGQTGSASVGQ
jgi:phage shock protein A